MNSESSHPNPAKVKTAFFSVSHKNYQLLALACAMKANDWKCIASGGTKTFLEEGGVAVTDVADITGLNPALDHRVATLHPKLHGGLLAEMKHAKELADLGWEGIGAVICTFYDLQKAMDNPKSDYDAINAQVDIGGPTLVRSACKGGRIVIADHADFEWLEHCFPEGDNHVTDNDIKWMHAKAAATIAAYVALESKFRIQQLRPPA